MELNMQTKAQDGDQITLNYLDLKVVPSYHCSMNCYYCYNNDIQNNYRENADHLIMNLTDIIEKHEREVVIELIGGEPLSSHCNEITNRILDHIGQLKREKIKIILQTATPNLKIIEDSLDRIDGLSYSIDISASHKANNLNKLKELVNLCDIYDVHLQIQTVLHLADTIGDIERFINICGSNGVRWLGVCYPQFKKYDSDDLNSQLKIYSQLINNLDIYKEMYIGGNPIQCILDFVAGWSYETSCYCGEKCLTIEPDGRISPCLYIGPNDYKSLNTFVTVKKRREEILREGECSNCDLWSVCHGGCLAHAAFLTGNINSRDIIQCYLIKKLINIIEGRISKNPQISQNLGYPI